MLQVLPLLCRGEAHALGPQQQWTDNLKAVSLMLDDIFILYKDGWKIKLEGLCKEDSVKKTPWKGLCGSLWVSYIFQSISSHCSFLAESTLAHINSDVTQEPSLLCAMKGGGPKWGTERGYHWSALASFKGWIDSTTTTQDVWQTLDETH